MPGTILCTAVTAKQKQKQTKQQLKTSKRQAKTRQMSRFNGAQILLWGVVKIHISETNTYITCDMI